jgi:hypothetical protein
METEDIPGTFGRTLVYWSPVRSLLLILGGLVLIAGAALMVIGAVPALPHPAAVLYLLIGGVGLLLFVPGVGRLMWQLAQRRPVLEIGPDGGARPAAVARGSAVVGGARRRPDPGAASGVRHARSHARRRGEVLHRAYERLVHRVNQRAGFRGLHMSVVGLRCTADELYEAVCRHRR